MAMNCRIPRTIAYTLSRTTITNDQRLEHERWTTGKAFVIESQEYRTHDKRRGNDGQGNLAVSRCLPHGPGVGARGHRRMTIQDIPAHIPRVPPRVCLGRMGLPGKIVYGKVWRRCFKPSLIRGIQQLILFLLEPPCQHIQA
jgi:hypothetical protein